MSQIRSCTVFVGNIPYDASEDELKAIFNKAGAVESFRLVYDKETKQPKGYGFCDYADADVAVAAIRNLSDVEFNGRRLRIDLADNALRAREFGSSLGVPAKPAISAGSFQDRALLPALPPSLSMPAPSAPPIPAAPVAPPIAAALPPGLIGMSGTPGSSTAEAYEEMLSGGATTVEAALAELSAHTEICQVVSAMPRAQVQLCLGSMQRLATEAPEESRAMLSDNPQLCYALLHMQLLLGMELEPTTPATAHELQMLRPGRVHLRPGFGAAPPSQGLVGLGGIIPGLGISRPPMPMMRPSAPALSGQASAVSGWRVTSLRG